MKNIVRILDIKQVTHDVEKLLESREIRIFKSVLDHLISSNSITKNRVLTEIVDI